jgi:hypothetical protein
MTDFPSNKTALKNVAKDVEWLEEQKIQASADIGSDSITVHNIRSTRYFSNEHDSQIRYYDRAIKIADIVSLSFLVEPFTKLEAVAHTFISFGLADGSHIAVSAEARQRKGQPWSLLYGLFNAYGIIYIVADESDVINLRVNHRHNPVFIYPIKASADKIQKMFVDVCQRLNALVAKPERFNLLTNSCTTNLLRHAEHAGIVDLPFYFYLLLPGLADRAAYRRGLIDTELPFEDAQREFHASFRVKKYADHPEFSRLIRETPATSGRIVLGPVSAGGGLEAETEQNLVRGA